MLAKKIIMYSSLTLLFKYIQYLYKASNGKGHGVHSPFVYQFIRAVLNQKAEHPAFAAIELQRKVLENNNELVQVWDRGAGSRQTQSTERRIGAIAKAALKPRKYSQLLYKIAAYYQPASILEMGTSLGITTCYLALANEKAQVVTMEGAPYIAKIAQNTFTTIGVPNVKLIEGDFEETLPAYIASQEAIGLAYVDGNHRYAPTIQYFKQLLARSNDASILIFDDIHWSEEMEAAWEEIKSHPAITLSIDLFFIGIVFVKKDFKEKQHFTIRF
jgi:predicted O-methyltransferase YrrM